MEIAGHTIRGGLFFVGRELQAPRSGRKDPSLLDPSARVAASGADVAGSSVPYWPSYSEITPAARLAHLQWLAGGRSDPDYGICYPFIFLYGLERRLFHDGETGDAAAIVAEVERLLAIYGRDYSFRTYASKLLGAAAALLDDVPKPTPSPALWTGEELPVAIRLHLGRRIAEGAALDADDALVWLLGHPETRTRTAIERCFPEARLLWEAKFAERFPSGMKVAAPKRTMLVRYGAASGEFEAEIVPSFAGRPVPDVVGLSAPLKWMREALDACSEELQPYSRLLGRKPEARGTIEAAFLVPKTIANTEFGAPAKAVGDALRARLTTSGMAATPVRTLMSSLGMPDTAEGKVPAATATQLGAILDRLDLGIEPDRRYGSGTPGLEGDVILFSAPGGGNVDSDRDEYKAMRTMIEVAVLAAAADDSKDFAELAAIEADIAASAGLGAAERARLQAFARHLMSAGTKQGNVLSRLAKMPDLDRKRVARSAMSAVLADGHASPAEIRFLEKLYKTMGLPVDDLYSAIHRGAIEVDAPVSIAPEEVAVGVAIPTGPSADASVAAPAPVVRVDQARLDRIRSETSAVSQLLADIFEEDAEDPAPVVRRDAASVTEAEGLIGLDRAHGRLLRSVEARGTVDRSEFDRLARDFGLLPDGAIETINEWAFDRFDESILDEDDDGLTVPDHLRAALSDVSETA
ncbi:hypothetical protein ASF65_03790 [Aureimonas sp. Leaf324]|nr:hypothetical protein ASF65_03790 [Aureimonas sp. Leaf324]